ncbi:hypothetical protein MMC27_008319 [Xylographa pallens]|nr:hypothetical protein [Xylographa pallens]
MLLIGLTGSIATGKSTVSALLSQPPYSLPIIDADLLARQVVEPGTRAYKQILAHFAATTPDLLLPADNNPETLSTGPQDPNGSSQAPNSSSQAPPSRSRPLNRPALGCRVFGRTPSRQRDRAVLNSIVHPAVRRAMALAVLKAYLSGHWAVVLDVPLLFESGLDIFCGLVMVAGVREPRIQMQRLRARDPHLSEREAGERVQSQGGVEGKVGRVAERGRGWGAVVWNDGGRAELAEGVARVMDGVEAGSPRWWGWVLLGAPWLAVGVGAWCMFWGWWARRRWESKEREREEEGGRGMAKL